MCPLTTSNEDESSDAQFCRETPDDDEDVIVHGSVSTSLKAFASVDDAIFQPKDHQDLLPLSAIFSSSATGTLRQRKNPIDFSNQQHSMRISHIPEYKSTTNSILYSQQSNLSFLMNSDQRRVIDEKTSSVTNSWSELSCQNSIFANHSAKRSGVREEHVINSSISNSSFVRGSFLRNDQQTSGMFANFHSQDEKSDDSLRISFASRLHLSRVKMTSSIDENKSYYDVELPITIEIRCTRAGVLVSEALYNSESISLRALKATHFRAGIDK